MAEKSSGVEFRLHVPLERRENLNDDAIQGELFAAADSEDAKRGYRGTVASKVAGITYRQLDYWARKQIVEPSITPSHGSGSRRLYSFKDVVILAVSKKLLDAGVNLQNVTAAIGFLSQRTTSQLANVTIMCDGQQVHECTTSEQMIDLLQSGTAVFGVSVGSLWHQIEEALEHEDYVDLELQPTAVAAGRPIDELTAMRMRRKLEAQRAQREAA
ncbi:MerR family transcriptional regulator [Bifidobacterium eulemuris]|uniref:Transcriptional regulator n=1 Tax=Bifidobacterium eulemuris TaxID=1765219 RepID=A0A261GD09_9BIFI|nr:MerR family transcriptional regulator [Bifidobacterium eulemuris]OZG69143.1 transcriptional regulator [Bifidobacterium eulemuris]QOL31342.1 MerR family transcriptional regulator [Bifidobacterium eulemuris]